MLSDGSAGTVIHHALKRLEYRGYDSVGEVTLFNGDFNVKKDKGKIDEVHGKLNLDALLGRCGIGHTRWATHGAPSKENAHPQFDCYKKIAVVHNGIIENFHELKTEMVNRGHSFLSLTDTEVIPHLIEESMANGLNFVEACRESVRKLEGSYALAVICRDEPDTIICARNESPIIIGRSKEGVYFSSDTPALLPLTNRVIQVNNGELVILRDDDIKIRNIDDWRCIIREPKTVSWTFEIAKKQGYPHFMLKEIHEQPICQKNALRLQGKYLDLLTTFLDRAKQIYLLASGTSYNACFAATYMFSSLCNISTMPVNASEFIEQYGEAVNIDSTILAVSQSGETADVLHAIEHARFKAATILGLTNTIGSSLTRVSRAYLCQQSGPEIGVAASKTFTSQLIVLAQLAMKLATVRGKVSQDKIDELKARIQEMPSVVKETIVKQEENVKKIVRKYINAKSFYFLGRGISTATALEARLKLLELAYIPSISYPAGESKHGPISLIEEGFPVIFVCPKDSTRRTLIGNIMEMKARGANIIAVIEEADKEIMEIADDYFEIPRGGGAGIPEILSPIPYVVPLQLFAYYMAVEKGYDPDKPRNLAKSVTVL